MNEVLTDTHPNMGRVLLVDDEPDQVALLRAQCSLRLVSTSARPSQRSRPSPPTEDSRST